MCRMVDEEGLFTALDDAVAVAREFDGAPIGDKLARFGLDEAGVSAVVRDRWDTYRKTFDPSEPEVMFVRAFTEGLLTGRVLP